MFSNIYQLDLHNKTHVPFAIYNEIFLKTGVKIEFFLISYDYRMRMFLFFIFNK
jgi:hypothetical protein